MVEPEGVKKKILTVICDLFFCQQWSIDHMMGTALHDG